jgi:hypothetical protein
MENEKLYFVIRKDNWPNGRVKYNIMKEKPFELSEATRMLLAYEQLNDDKDHTYHLLPLEEFLSNSKDTVVMANGSHNMDTI